MRTCELAKALGISWGNCKDKILRGMPTDLEGARYYTTHVHEHIPLAQTRRLKKWHAEHREEMKMNIKKANAARKRWELENPQKYREKLEAMQKRAHDKMRGSNGFGRSGRGHPENVCAVWWRVQSPDGVTYSFVNLTNWCRENEGLFCDSGDIFKLPLWRRAAAGIGQLTTQSREARSSWRGWIVINRGELDKKKLRRKRGSEASHEG